MLGEAELKSNAVVNPDFDYLDFTNSFDNIWIMLEEAINQDFITDISHSTSMLAVWQQCGAWAANSIKLN